ncbi:hypothetical protein [Actinoplanes sp. NBRC 101535]|uniref:hypothetical protein n=1 Tax=Actinoplanes sp. NBRC 101535 TaxID=3032196 RepID=UPI0024A30DFD|nr:hypothetical protein [Actinoplanes sp. NBRC 101535]GLY00780.1 hypothetical protein Acsp01_11590 [Actinoplanes sp. NBRC 101535]
MTDIDQLFAELRTRTIAEVRPPSVDTVHRIVRRRRAVRNAVAGTVLLALGGTGLLLLPGEPEPDAPDPRAGYGTIAAATVKLDVATPRLGALVTDLGDGTWQHRLELIGATYRTTLTCVGAGEITAVLTPAGGDPSRVVVPCTAEPLETMIDVVLGGDLGTLTTEVVPDDVAAESAAFAYTTALSTADQDRLGKLAGGVVGGLTTPAFVLGDTTPAIEQRLTGAAYQATAACAGTGSATFTVVATGADNTETVLGQTRVTCSPAPKPVTVTVTYPAGATALALRLAPEADAYGQAVGVVGYRPT